MPSTYSFKPMQLKNDCDTNKTCKNKSRSQIESHISVPSTYRKSRWLLGFHVLVHTRPCTDQPNLGASKSSILTPSQSQPKSFTNWENPENEIGSINMYIYIYIYIFIYTHIYNNLCTSISNGQNKHPFIPSLHLLP